MAAKSKMVLISAAVSFAVSFSPPSFAQTSGVDGTQTSQNASRDGPARADAAELAEQLVNPISNLISVPFQFNYDTGLGQTDADRWILNIQPVIPFDLSEDWNLISRTIVPVIDLESPVAGGNDVSGIGDLVQSFFFSPKAPTANGWIWGAGPVSRGGQRREPRVQRGEDGFADGGHRNSRQVFSRRQRPP